MKCSNTIHSPKILFLLVLSYMLFGCSTTGSAHTGSNYTPPTYVRNAQGITVYRIQEGNVFKPNGERVARIDSSGNIWTTTGTRLGRISKR